jgi:hypothetical protein
MINVFDEVKAEGKAEGMAKGIVTAIRHQVAKGHLSVDAARAEIREMIEAGEIPAEVGREALGLLG